LEWHQNLPAVRVYRDRQNQELAFSKASDWEMAMQASREMTQILAKQQAKAGYVPSASASSFTYESCYLREMRHFFDAALGNAAFTMTSVAEDDPQFLENPARRREFLEVMMRGAKEMCLLIDNILESHRLKSGAVELKLSSVSLVPLLDETCKDFYYQTRRKEITIVRDGPDQGLMLEADRAKVMRIVQNLLANAIKFSPRGGKIVLNTRSNNGEVTIRVMDEGQGIEADQIPMIMQDSPAIKKAGADGEDKSYGIGLKVVREFVYLHGGRFWVEPNSPKGAQFCFTLPLRQADPNPKSKIQNPKL
jgi:signal transduction histidine kinase